MKKISLENELKVMVAMDLTQMDPILLGYISFLCTVLNIEHLYFTHNIKQYKLYDLYDDILDQGVNIEDIVDRALQESVKKHYNGSAPFTVIITTDDYTESILTHLAEEYKIDIMVAGNKDELQGTGALSQKLVRMFQGNVLLVPESTSYQMKKVLVPTDFSSDSAKSFKAAESLIHKSVGEIEALHVYNIPSYFFPYINTQKAKDKTTNHLKDKVQQYRKKFQIPEDIKFRYTDREDLSVVEAIEIHAEKGDFDMIVVSARGSNNITSLFIGSITNDLLIRNRRMPLLVVK